MLRHCDNRFDPTGDLAFPTPRLVLPLPPRCGAFCAEGAVSARSASHQFNLGSPLGAGMINVFLVNTSTTRGAGLRMRSINSARNRSRHSLQNLGVTVGGTSAPHFTHRWVCTGIMPALAGCAAASCSKRDNRAPSCTRGRSGAVGSIARRHVRLLPRYFERLQGCG